MAFIYAMSDMHGDMEAFGCAMSVVDLNDPKNMVVFCGDYMLPPDGDFTLIRQIMTLQDEHPGQVIALMGNHEHRFIKEHRFTDCEDDPAFAWMKRLPYYYETEDQIFVHAGVDEEAWDLWKVGTPEEDLCEKPTWSEGEFLKDVIAGHIGTFNMAGDETFHDVYWDGASHYYLDGTVHKSGQIPVLKYDTERKRYTAFTFDDDGNPKEYELKAPSASMEASRAAVAGKVRPRSRQPSKKPPVDKKLWPFFILKVLKRHAADGAEHDEDGNRYLTRQQIVDFLLDDYGIDTQIRAVGDNLTRLYDASLEDDSLGFRLEYLEGERKAAGEISAKGAKQLLRRGWRYIEVVEYDPDHEFEPSEVRMLIDTVIASSVIPPHQIGHLIKKLNFLVDNEIVIPNTMREGHLPAENHEFFLNVEILHEAIRDKKHVEFTLGLFGKDGRLSVSRRGKQGSSHAVIPMQLLVSKGHYYLLAHYPDGENVYKYRIDLMKDVRIIEDSHVDASESRINIVKFREQHAYMMSGKVVRVVLRINKESLHVLYDQFGPKVYFKNEQEDTVDVEFKSALYSVLFWALQYYRTVEVLSPPELRQVLADAGGMIHEMYAEEPGAVGLADRQSNDELINGK